MTKTPARRNPRPDREDPLLDDIRRLIEETRSAVATAVNAGLTMLYWRIGRRIREEILHENRAAYGDQIVHALSARFQRAYDQGL